MGKLTMPEKIVNGNGTGIKVEIPAPVEDNPATVVDETNPALTGINADRDAALGNNTTTYDGMISNVDTNTAAAIQASEDGAQKLIDAQNEYTDTTVGIIEGQKEEARKDYEDETRGAYVEWKLQSDPFGANAEHMAANGLSRSGYSESSKVRMYQAYQSRRALAYKAFSKAITEYNNQITMARSQNSVTIAQIASNALQEQAKIALEGFYYKNDLITKKADQELKIKSYYDGLYKDVYDRLYGEDQDRQAQANWQAEFDATYGDEDVVVDKDNTAPLNPDYIPEDEGGTLPTPSFTTGNPSLDRNLGLGGQVPQPLPNVKLNFSDSSDKYPDYPTLPNGQPAFLTLEQVGEENIHTVNDNVIYETFGNISPEELNELVERGYVKEVFYKDKDGKIGMTFKVVHETTAKEYLESKKGGTNSSTNADATGWWTRLWESVANGIAYSGSGGSGWIR